MQQREDVAQVFHPALPEHPGHALWQRDFSGSNGLLSFTLANPSLASAEAFVNGLRLFGIGASWGGYESLVTLAGTRERQFAPTLGGPLVRLHVGLEDVRSLQRDLDQALRQVY